VLPLPGGTELDAINSPVKSLGLRAALVKLLGGVPAAEHQDMERELCQAIKLTANQARRLLHIEPCHARLHSMLDRLEKANKEAGPRFTITFKETKPEPQLVITFPFVLEHAPSEAGFPWVLRITPSLFNTPLHQLAKAGKEVVIATIFGNDSSGLDVLTSFDHQPTGVEIVSAHERIQRQLASFCKDLDRQNSLQRAQAALQEAEAPKPLRCGCPRAEVD